MTYDIAENDVSKQIRLRYDYNDYITRIPIGQQNVYLPIYRAVK